MTGTNKGGPNQCAHEVHIGMTSWVYLCTLERNHDGPCNIAISQEFDIRTESGEPMSVMRAFGCSNCDD